MEAQLFTRKVTVLGENLEESLHDLVPSNRFCCCALVGVGSTEQESHGPCLWRR